MSDLDVNDIIASIEDGNFGKALQRINKEPPKRAALVFAKVLDVMDLKVFEQAQQLQLLKSRLAAYEASEDLTGPQFIDGLISSIVNTYTACKAKDLYDLDWFSELEFSNVVKTQIAQRLVKAVGSFNPSFIPDLWNNIITGEPAAIDAITFKRNPSTMEENSDDE